ncbi:1,5-anhydro-D-fructose reductase-like [Sitophilus oryzae]|uniref:1,5-anhydro-D-fructose reductase-like n=1 Tax=Sitophilus oryzae TaxID=7048 RepID=A0A6J2Y8D9_SITOR|nr:1,5-anhydro-D-fructose reductase-like [Sitophilus oryzae]
MRFASRSPFSALVLGFFFENLRKYSVKMSVVVPNIDLKTSRGSLPMPILGYGTWQATDQELEAAVESALQAGYRHIDTAHVYENEKVIGTVLKRWINSGKLKRDELFLVTKLPPGGMRPEGVKKYIKRSLDLLQVDYVDLYLVHTPFAFNDVEGELHPFKPDGSIDLDVNTDHIAIWKAMEEQVDKGLTKAIGVSNFNLSQIQRILNNSRIKPCSLQVELHAYNQQKELVDFCKKNSMVVTAYSPLGNPGLSNFLTKFGKTVELPNIMKNPTVNELAKKYGKTPAQILLKHTVQRGVCVIPKSTNPERLRQNIDIFGFELDKADMEAMDGLDQGVRLLDFTLFKGIKDHPEYPFPELK